MRYSAATSKTTTAAAGFITDLRAATTRDIRVWEVGVFAETAVSGTVGLVRSATAGTGAATSVTPQADDSAGGAAASAALTTAYATTAPTAAAVALRRVVLPATIGAGIVWTFPEGLIVPSGTFSATANGLLVWQYSTAAVTYSVYVTYDE